MKNSTKKNNAIGEKGHGWMDDTQIGSKNPGEIGSNRIRGCVSDPTTTTAIAKTIATIAKMRGRKIMEWDDEMRQECGKRVNYDS